ncbi:Sialidase [Orchesella cincta]|uniref:Sialidase n=1 Tax=Orchesella cincta TaxID=48709 RepID=A0A1D2NKJ5_ORCCI|nr:Sialidase [Orchesella cincta]
MENMNRRPPKQKENPQKEIFCQTQEDSNLENYLENVSSNELVASNGRNETRSKQNRCDFAARADKCSKPAPKRCATAGPQYRSQACHSSREVCEGCGCVLTPQRQQHSGCCATTAQCDKCAEDSGCYQNQGRCNASQIQYIRRPCSAAGTRCQTKTPQPKCPITQPTLYGTCIDKKQRVQSDHRLVSAIGVKGETKKCTFSDAQCDTRPCTADSQCDPIPCSTVDAQCESRPCLVADAQCESRPCLTMDAECESRVFSTIDAHCDSRPCIATEAQCDPCAYTTVEAQCEPRPCSTVESQYEDTESCTATETQCEANPTADAQCDSRPCSTVEVQCDPIPYSMNDTQCDPQALTEAPCKSAHNMGIKSTVSRSEANNCDQDANVTSYCSRVPSATDAIPDRCPHCPSNAGSQGSLICEVVSHTSRIPIVNSSAYNSYCSRVPSLQQCNDVPRSCMASAQPSKETCQTTVSSCKLKEGKKDKSKPPGTVSSQCVAVKQQSAPVENSKVAHKPAPLVDPKTATEQAAPVEVKASTDEATVTDDYKPSAEKSAPTGKGASAEVANAEQAYSKEYPKAAVAEFTSEDAIKTQNVNVSKAVESSKSDSALLPARTTGRRNKDVTFKNVHSVQPEIDLAIIRSTSRTALNERLSTMLKPGISGLMEFMSERSIARGKKREELKLGGHEHHDEEKDFIDYFLDCNGLKYLGILEQFQLDYEDRVKSDLLHSEPTNTKIAHMLRKRLGDIAQVQPSTEEKALMDIDFAESLEMELNGLQIDHKPKVIAIGRLHQYGIEMAEYWVDRIKQGQTVDPHEICEVGTQTAAEMMGQLFSVLVKSCEFLDKIGKEPRRFSHKHSVDQLTQVFTKFRSLVVEEIGAIGETCGQVMVRIPDLRKSKVDEMMSDLYNQINFADVCLSRGLLAVIPMILYFDFRLKDA